jgi:hypothetical protein
MVAARSAIRPAIRPAAVGALAAVSTAAIIGVTTDVIPNPWFGRKTPVQGFEVAVVVALSVLTGALAATYVLAGGPATPRRAGIGSGVLGWFAVSCPLCNKIVVGLLGTSGALGTFEPLQPALGAAAIAVSCAALAVRVRAIRRGACPIRTPWVENERRPTRG